MSEAGKHGIAMPVAFRTLDLPEPVLQGIEAAGFTHCTPIQELTLPLILQGTHFAGQAQTGTGKTAAFLFGSMSGGPSRTARRRRSCARSGCFAASPQLTVQIHE